MKQNLLILAAILAAVAAYTAYEGRKTFWANKSADSAEQTTLANRDAPDFTFTSLKGKSYSLSDFKGKVIILNFWASWCTPCLVEFPQMLQLASLKKDKAVFVFMSVDEDKKNIERFLKKLGNSYDRKNVIVSHDPDKAISQNLFQTYKLPETYLIDSEFKLRDKVVGLATWNDDSMQKKIDSLYKR